MKHIETIETAKNRISRYPDDFYMTRDAVLELLNKLEQPAPLPFWKVGEPNEEGCYLCMIDNDTTSEVKVIYYDKDVGFGTSVRCWCYIPPANEVEDFNSNLFYPSGIRKVIDKDDKKPRQMDLLDVYQNISEEVYNSCLNDSAQKKFTRSDVQQIAYITGVALGLVRR